MDESALRTLIANLEVFRSSGHWWLEFCTALVAIGVLFEVIFVVWEYADELHDFGRGIVHPPERPKVLLFALGLLGAGLVAIGVAGELYFESEIETTETRIRKANDDLFLLLSREAGDAKSSAASAKASEEALEKKADALTNRLEEASGKLNDIEQVTLAQGPRSRLLEHGEDIFIKALKPFAGQRITVVRCRNEDREQFDFESALAQVWPKVGWTTGFAREDQCPVIGWNEIHFVTNAGNFAERWAGSPAEQWAKAACGNKDKTAAGALCNVLNRLKIRTIGWEERHTPAGGERNAQQVLILGNEAEMALKDPDTIFFLIGHHVPMFANRNKHPNKKTPTK